MGNEDLVFCTWDADRGIYVGFWHEADVLLHALGQEVAEKKITSAQAREVYARYYDVDDTYLIDPEDVEEEVAALREMAKTDEHYSPEDLQSDIESLTGEYGNFPLNEELDQLPNSITFWGKADELHLPGVGFSDERTASEPMFIVYDAEALMNLQEEFRRRYRIVLEEGTLRYIVEDSEEARQLIERVWREQLDVWDRLE